MNENYLNSIRKLFSYYKQLGEKAMAQLDDAQIHRAPDASSNNVAIMVTHLSSNMLSRWTDFMTTDGEKEWRHRDREFEDDIKDKKELLDRWEKGWACLFHALDELTPGDLEKIVYIRNQEHTVTKAINRQLAHYAYHVGQMVYLARHLAGNEWVSLSIPKGESEAYNQTKFDRDKSR